AGRACRWNRQSREPLAPELSRMKRTLVDFEILALALLAAGTRLAPAVTVTGEIVDARRGRPLPARLYIQASNGAWFFAGSDSPAGSAIRYTKQNWVHTNAVEMHVTLSPHPFRVDLPPGDYSFTVERGTEFRPLIRRVAVGNEPLR